MCCPSWLQQPPGSPSAGRDLWAHLNQSLMTLPLSHGEIHIGISGWRYKGWRGRFYPAKLAQRRELEFASRTFNSIEINGTFYSLQRPESFARWHDETPDDFVFAVKGPRYITHMLKLRNAETALANFFAQGVLRLGAKLGPILWQFPPKLHFSRERFEEFFGLLPRTTKKAASLARRHSDRLEGRAFTRALANQPLRHCIEIRHESFACADCVTLLRQHNIGFVVADTVQWPLLMDVTADFVYCRLHGSEELYASGYEDAALDEWADKVVSWAAGGHAASGRFVHNERMEHARRDVYVYFDNDAKVRAPFDAQQLQKKVDARLRSLSKIPR